MQTQMGLCTDSDLHTRTWVADTDGFPGPLTSNPKLLGESRSVRKSVSERAE